MRRVVWIGAAVLTALATVFLSLPGADAQKVANPGAFSIAPTNGVILINTTSFSLAPRALPECSDGVNNDGLAGTDFVATGTAPANGGDPQCTSADDDSELAGGFQPKVDPVFNGTIDAAGNITIPTAGVVLPKAYIAIPDVNPANYPYVVTAEVIATAAATGTLNPLTGAANIRLRFRIKLNGSPFGVYVGASCSIGTSAAPIDINVLTTATTSPPPPNLPISGSPYLTNGTFRLVNNSFAVPGASGCAPLGFDPNGINNAINTNLGLPAAAGKNSAVVDGQTTPVLIRGVIAKITTDPVLLSGESPFTVAFDGSSSTVTNGPASYLWQFPDGSTSTEVSPTRTFSNLGLNTVRLTVTDADGDSATVQKNVNVTAPTSTTTSTTTTVPTTTTSTTTTTVPTTTTSTTTTTTTTTVPTTTTSTTTTTVPTTTTSTTTTTVPTTTTTAPPALCSPGTFSATGSEPCQAAPAGSFVNTTGATSATLCDAGSYSPSTGATSCLLAPPGTFVSSTGAAAATPCELGSFNGVAGSTTCLLAPIGSYVDTVGATAPTACPEGSTNSAAGATSASSCIPITTTTTTTTTVPTTTTTVPTTTTTVPTTTTTTTTTTSTTTTVPTTTSTTTTTTTVPTTTTTVPTTTTTVPTTTTTVPTTTTTVPTTTTTTTTPALRDQVTVGLTGSVNYNRSATSTAGDVAIVRDANGIVSTRGTLDYAGASGGTAKLTVNVQRFWIFPLWVGDVRVWDAPAGVSVQAPVFGSVQAPAANAAQGQTSWFTVGTFPNLIRPFNLTWRVDDRS
jgi:PKD repeat protein